MSKLSKLIRIRPGDAANVARAYYYLAVAGWSLFVRRQNLGPWLVKRKVQPDLFFVGTDGGRIVATVMAGYDGHRGWIYYLAVDPDYQRKHIGRRMMAKAEFALQKRGCPKINLQVRTSNLAVISFYKRLGFSNDDVIGLGKRL